MPSAPFPNFPLPRSNFSDFAAKNSKDERFKAVEKLRDRETYFQDFLGDMRKKEKEEKAKEKEKVRSFCGKARFSCFVRSPRHLKMVCLL